jgi:hypothetical protein
MKRWTISVPDDTAAEVMSQLSWGDNRSAWVVDAIEQKLARQQEPEPADTEATLDAAIAAWEPPGEVDPAHARAALRDAVAWLAAHEGRATKREIVAGARGDSPLGARSWWERAVQPGLRALAAVEYRPGYHDYMLEKE